MKKIFSTAMLCCITALSAFSWGQKGHDVTAYIAEQHLTQTAKNAVDSLLDGKSMVYWANWLDNASHTDKYSYTKTWHYKNIDSGADYDNVILNPAGDVVSAIKEQTEKLQSGTLSKTESSLALKILIHLMGDLHQPMHMGHKSDLGGNNWVVKYFGRDNKLHSIWDSQIVESAHKWSYTEWAIQIDCKNEEIITFLTDGNIDNWGKQTFELATEIYDKTPQQSNISYDYIAEWTPIIEQQFLSGGLRLSKILNTIFSDEH